MAVRKKYGVSAAKMSLILGFGTNQWRLYESGEVPSVSNGRMIRSIMDPSAFLCYVHSSRHLLEEKEYKKVSARIEEIAEITERRREEHYALSRIFQCERGEENGFAPQSS